jgi:hypothetical protein
MKPSKFHMILDAVGCLTEVHGANASPTTPGDGSMLLVHLYGQFPKSRGSNPNLRPPNIVT